MGCVCQSLKRHRALLVLGAKVHPFPKGDNSTCPNNLQTPKNNLHTPTCKNNDALKPAVRGHRRLYNKSSRVNNGTFQCFYFVVKLRISVK